MIAYYERYTRRPIDREEAQELVAAGRPVELRRARPLTAYAATLRAIIEPSRPGYARVYHGDMHGGRDFEQPRSQALAAAEEWLR